MSIVEDIADWLVTKNEGTLGTDLFCYIWGSDVNDAILVTSTGGNSPDRFIDGDNSRINYTFINIMIRSNDMGTGLEKAEEILSLFEKNIVSGMFSNKPRRNEVIYIGNENTTLGKIYYFGIDLLIKNVSSNN